MVLMHHLTKVAAVITAAATLAGCSGEVKQGGPLDKPNQHAWTRKASVGEAFTDGSEVLTVNGDKPVVIESAELIDAPGIKLVGVKLVQPGRQWGSIQTMPWPPEDPDLKPSLPGHRSAHLAVGVGDEFA